MAGTRSVPQRRQRRGNGKPRNLVQPLSREGAPSLLVHADDYTHLCAGQVLTCPGLVLGSYMTLS